MNVSFGLATAVGGSVLVGNLVHAAMIAGDPPLPESIQIIGVLGMPAVAALALIASVFHISDKLGKKVDVVQTKVDGVATQSQENTERLNGRLSELLSVSNKQSYAEGAIAGYAQAMAESKALADKALVEEGLRKQGADALLAAQQTPAATEPKPS